MTFHITIFHENLYSINKEEAVLIAVNSYKDIWKGACFGIILVDPRASTMVLHPDMSFVALLAPSRYILMLINSPVTLLLHVCLGQLLFLFPCGFNSCACRLIFLIFSSLCGWPTAISFFSSMQPFVVGWLLPTGQSLVLCRTTKQ